MPVSSVCSFKTPTYARDLHPEQFRLRHDTLAKSLAHSFIGTSAASLHHALGQPSLVAV